MSSFQHPFHVGFKRLKKLFQTQKHDGFLLSINMAMVALATFVIVSKHALAVDH